LSKVGGGQRKKEITRCSQKGREKTGVAKLGGRVERTRGKRQKEIYNNSSSKSNRTKKRGDSKLPLSKKRRREGEIRLIKKFKRNIIFGVDIWELHSLTGNRNDEKMTKQRK